MMASTLKSYVHNNELVSAILPVVSFLSSSGNHVTINVHVNVMSQVRYYRYWFEA